MAVEFIRYLDKSLKYLHRQGAFLTVKGKGAVNVTTISWGNIGFEWGRPIFTILIRKSRYAHELLQETDEFTVSIPTTPSMKKALQVCGSKTGRKTDKFKEAGISQYPSKNLATPVVKESDIFYECKIVYRHKIDPEILGGDIDKTSYLDGDYHEIFYGEIIGAYGKDAL